MPTFHYYIELFAWWHNKVVNNPVPFAWWSREIPCYRSLNTLANLKLKRSWISVFRVGLLNTFVETLVKHIREPFVCWYSQIPYYRSLPYDLHADYQPKHLPCYVFFNIFPI